MFTKTQFVVWLFIFSTMTMGCRAQYFTLEWKQLSAVPEEALDNLKPSTNYQLHLDMGFLQQEPRAIRIAPASNLDFRKYVYLPLSAFESRRFEGRQYFVHKASQIRWRVEKWDELLKSKTQERVRTCADGRSLIVKFLVQEVKTNFRVYESNSSQAQAELLLAEGSSTLPEKRESLIGIDPSKLSVVQGLESKSSIPVRSL